jgi:hypothetical protein
MIMLQLRPFIFLCAIWLPQGENFDDEALDFMSQVSAAGEGLFSLDSEKAFAQQLELKNDHRDWEGAAAKVLDPINGLAGEGTAIQILHTRETFGDKRIISALISRLDYEADLAVADLQENPEYSLVLGSFLNLVGNICKSGQPEIVGFILKRMLVDNGKYYELIDSQNYISVFKWIKKSGSGENLPELKLLVAKLEKDGKTKAVDLGREAIIDITRRSEGVKGGGTSSGDSLNSRQKSEVSGETASDSFTPGKAASVLIVALLVGAAAYFTFRRK